jgi:hypothetical protein
MKSIFMKFRIQVLLFSAIGAFTFSCNQPHPKTEASERKVTSGELDRTVLPIKEPNYPNDTTLDAVMQQHLLVLKYVHQIKRPMSSLC